MANSLPSANQNGVVVWGWWPLLTNPDLRNWGMKHHSHVLDWNRYLRETGAKSKVANGDKVVGQRVGTACHKYGTSCAFSGPSDRLDAREARPTSSRQRCQRGRQIGRHGTASVERERTQAQACDWQRYDLRAESWPGRGEV